MKTLHAIAIALPMIVSAGAAMASSFSGTYQVTVTDTPHNNGTYCLTLTDDGSVGRRHSGEAAISGGFNGTFQLIDHTILVAIEIPGENGQNEGLVDTVAVRDGVIGDGLTILIYGGAATYSGKVIFAPKGSC